MTMSRREVAMMANKAATKSITARTDENARRAKRLRQEFGYTQEELAVRMEVSVSTIARWLARPL